MESPPQPGFDAAVTAPQLLRAYTSVDAPRAPEVALFFRFALVFGLRTAARACRKTRVGRHLQGIVADCATQSAANATRPAHSWRCKYRSR